MSWQQDAAGNVIMFFAVEYFGSDDKWHERMFMRSAPAEYILDVIPNPELRSIEVSVIHETPEGAVIPFDPETLI